jgi:polysaccharide biosynthesis/export protein
MPQNINFKKNITMKTYIQLFFFGLLTLASCVSHQELLYLNDLPNKDLNEAISNQKDLQVQPDDLLSITVASYNAEASRPFNTEAANTQAIATASQGTANTAEMFIGYFVDNDGHIDYPVLGKVFVNNKTLTEIKQIFTEKLKVYLKDPVVNVRFLNLKVSILGEVARPGTLRLTNKRLTIFEAIGLAGDLTPYANRNKVVVIREKNGKREIANVNLQSSSVFSSPYYYLQQNDVIYFKPTKYRANTVADQTTKIVSFSTIGITLVTLMLTILR